MLYGFAGRVLHVDLTSGQLIIERPDEAFYRQYPGGSLMGLYYLWRNTPPGIDAFDPRNTLTFALSAPTGLAAGRRSSPHRLAARLRRPGYADLGVAFVLCQ